MEKKEIFFDSDVLSGLSASTLSALRDFALSSGVNLTKDNDEPNKKENDDGSDVLTLLRSVNNHFGLQEREENFNYTFTDSNDSSYSVSFNLRGLKKELGQTLESTGLTIWRAAEHLCQFLIDNRQLLKGKRVCELGAGLGLVSVLVDKFNLVDKLVVTDGDEDTLKLLVENKIENDCDFSTSYLFWGENEDFLSEHSDKFNIILAADVIYDPAQVEPLLTTANEIMTDDGEFILAFARRQVPLDKVLESATSKGFEYKYLDTKYAGENEPVLSLKRKK